jgi:hypothetical protein
MSSYIGADFDVNTLITGLSTVFSTGAQAGSAAYVASQQTEQAKILSAAGSTGSAPSIPTSAWSTMSKPLMIGAAALAGVVLIMTLTRR